MSDLHLGPIKDVKFAEKITELSNSLSPDLVFVGGDLYDGSHHPDPYILANPLKNLSSRLGKFFITGNHEEFGKPDIFLSAVQKLGIKILQNEMVEIKGLQIIGVDFLNASPKKQFQKILEDLKIDRKKPSILLKHEPKNLAVAEKAGISFQISGHTHNGQQWPFNYLTKIMYKGFSYGLKHHGSMPIYISSGAGGWGPPLRVGSNYEIVEIIFI
jgi:predicted MPP superfamily phosphohydrolase